MRIIFLDRPTFLPDWLRDRLRTVAEFEDFHDEPDEETAVRRLAECDLAIVEWTNLTRDVLRRAQRLRHIALVTSAFDFVDVAAAAECGISVSYCPSYAAHSVAEHIFALILSLTRHIRAAESAVRGGSRHEYGPFLGVDLRGRRLGIVGTGRTAIEAAAIARGFGMEVVFHSHSGRPIKELPMVTLDELLATSDVISLQIPLNASTRMIIDAERLSMMKSSAYLINIGRPQLLDQPALAMMLREGRLAGAGLDDLADPGGNQFYDLPNVVLTPGIAWFTKEALEANMIELWQNIEAFMSGHPSVNIVPIPAR
jgi:glycerate dehydrogenase